MSNERLLKATAGRYQGPFFPGSIVDLQKIYCTRRFRRHPINDHLLQYFAEDLKMIFTDVEFDPDFVTDDGTHWFGVRFRYITGTKYKLAFPKEEDPKHRDGTTSSHHIALYCLDENIDERQLRNVAQAAYALYQSASHDYEHPRSAKPD